MRPAPPHLLCLAPGVTLDGGLGWKLVTHGPTRYGLAMRESRGLHELSANQARRAMDGRTRGKAPRKRWWILRALRPGREGPTRLGRPHCTGASASATAVRIRGERM